MEVSGQLPAPAALTSVPIEYEAGWTSACLDVLEK